MDQDRFLAFFEAYDVGKPPDTFSCTQCSEVLPLLLLNAEVLPLLLLNAEVLPLLLLDSEAHHNYCKEVVDHFHFLQNMNSGTT